MERIGQPIVRRCLALLKSFVKVPRKRVAGLQGNFAEQKRKQGEE
jgi:hypothetical protein